MKKTEHIIMYTSAQTCTKATDGCTAGIVVCEEWCLSVFEVKTALGALVLPNRHDVLGTRSMWHLGGDHVRREHDPHVTIGSRRGTDSLPCRGRKWCAG